MEDISWRLHPPLRRTRALEQRCLDELAQLAMGVGRDATVSEAIFVSEEVVVFASQVSQGNIHHPYCLACGSIIWCGGRYTSHASWQRSALGWPSWPKP